MSVDIAASDIEALKEEQKRVAGCLVGTYPGIQSQTPSEEDIKGTNNNSFNKTASNISDYTKSLYGAAMSRDLKYCVYNRKAMRINGAADKLLSCLYRGKAVAIIDILKS